MSFFIKGYTIRKSRIKCYQKYKFKIVVWKSLYTVIDLFSISVLLNFGATF